MDFDVNRVLIIHYENIFKIFKNIVIELENTLYYFIILGKIGMLYYIKIVTCKISLTLNFLKNLM
jgi:hypothetical protein